MRRTPVLMMVIATLTTAVVVAGSAVGRRAQAVSTTRAGAFDTITYRDSGGFTGAGTGLWLTVAASGSVEARSRTASTKTRSLQGQELADLNAAVSAVDWAHIEGAYRTPGAADLVTRDLTIVIRGRTYETHADGLAKIPAGLRELFSRLDAIYGRTLRTE